MRKTEPDIRIVARWRQQNVLGEPGGPQELEAWSGPDWHASGAMLDRRGMQV